MSIFISLIYGQVWLNEYLTSVYLQPTYMDTTAMKVEQVEEVEEEEDEVKCEEDNLDLPQSCGGLACHIEEGQATYTQTLPGTSISGGSGGGGGGVLPQYPGPPQSLEEVVSQALPGTSGVNGVSWSVRVPRSEYESAKE